jgi:predicted MFS family arabinose efflux permease
MSQALGLFGAASLSMNAFAPGIAEEIAERFGWTWVFALSALAALVAAALSFLIKEVPTSRPTQHADAPSTASTLVDGLKYAFSNGRGRLFYVCAVAGSAFGAVFTFVGPFALELGATRVATFFMGYTAAALFVRICFGNSADRYGRRKIALGALTLYALVLLAMTCLTPGLLILFGALVGVAHGMFYPALNAMAIGNSDPTRRGTVMAYFSGAFNAGFSASVVPCGFVARHFGYPTVFVITGIVTLSAVYSLAKARGSS